MEKMKYTPAQLRSMAVILSVVLLAAVVTVVITLLSGADRPAPVPNGSDTDTVTEKRPVVQNPPIDTEDVGGETDRPTLHPIPGETDPSIPTVTPIKWMMPLDGAYLSKGHDLTKQVFSQTMNDYRVHCGVDLQTSLGADVMAVADGVVDTIYVDPFEGTCIRIAHADGYESVYKNLAPELLEGLGEGDTIIGGQTIASVGESAMIEISDEAHLHLEMYLDGKPIDPLTVIPYDPDSADFNE